LAGPVWANEAAELIVSQAFAPADAGLDAEEVKQLDANAQELFEAGKYAEASAVVARSLAWKESKLGPDHPVTALSLNNLAWLYGNQGLYAKAEPLFQRALAIREKALGPEHPDTAQSLNNLAELYQAQGRYAKAEPLYKRALAINENALGPENPTTALSLNNLAALYYNQGLYANAEPLYQRALEISEKALGPEHPKTAISLSSLALLYEEKGLYAKAEPLHKRALAISEKALGSEHLHTSIYLSNLGSFYQRKGLHAEAEPLYRRALAISEKILGLEHPDNAASLNKLARLYEEQGLYLQAEPLYERALAIRQKVLGPDHAQTATSLNNIALLYMKQGLYDKAEVLYQRALAINEKAMGPNHPATATNLDNLAEVYRNQGLYSKAATLYERALLIQQRALGYEHQSTTTSLNNLAVFYEELGLYSKAEPLHKEALKIRKRSLGPLHPDTAQSLHNLAALFRSQGLYAKAEKLYQEAIAISEKALGPEHPNTATSLSNLALLYDDQGLYAKAEPLLQQVLAIREKVLGPEHPATASSLNSLGVYYGMQGLDAKSEPLLKRALRIREKMLGPEHRLTASSLNNLAVNFYGQGQYAKFESLIRQGLLIEFTLIQREAPYLPVADRQSYLHTFGGAYEAAFSSAQRGSSGANLALFSRLNRQGLLQEIEQRQAQLASLPGAQQALATSLRQVTKQLASMSLNAEQRQQLRSRQDELERQLYRLLPQLKPRVVEVQQVAAALPAGSTLIEFQQYRPFDSKAVPEKQQLEARYLAMVLTSDGTITPIDLGLAKPIDASIRLALKASERGHPDALGLWASVGNLVLDPLASATKGSSALFISPDGELNRIPFAALPAPGRPNQMLADLMKFRLLTTGRELLDLQNASKVKPSQSVIVANPTFHRSVVPLQTDLPVVSNQQRSIDLGSPKWNQLPGTAKEGAAIALLLGGRLLTDNKASATAIQQQKEAPRVIHLATHAYYQPDLVQAARQGDQQRAAVRQHLAPSGAENPLLRSGIVLAGANHPEADPDDDGYLTALEVARLNWKGTEMVVISACQSGKGDITAGEGVYGLKRAIAVAGARSSLLSLWNVDDRATAAFMESFYSKLKAGIDRSDALSATQKEFREHEIVSWRHPYVWAAFQLSGDWGRLGKP
jgi:tetratricopeptide (TPR) repeat protein